MQHKRDNRGKKTLFALAAFVIVGGLGLLMTANPPPPTHSIEKTLDAKAFLEQK